MEELGSKSGENLGSRALDSHEVRRKQGVASHLQTHTHATTPKSGVLMATMTTPQAYTDLCPEVRDTPLSASTPQFTPKPPCLGVSPNEVGDHNPLQQGDFSPSNDQSPLGLEQKPRYIPPYARPSSTNTSPVLEAIQALSKQTTSENPIGFEAHSPKRGAHSALQGNYNKSSRRRLIELR